MGVNPGGGGGDGGMYPPPPPPHFFGWGDDLYLKFDIYCKEIDLFDCKTIKTPKLARSHTNVLCVCVCVCVRVCTCACVYVCVCLRE